MSTLADLPVGTKIYFSPSLAYKTPSNNYHTLNCIIIGQDYDGEGTTTLQFETIIDLKAFDAKETTHPDGHERYIYSTIRQWLNSTAVGGSWFTASYEGDCPPEEGRVSYFPYSNQDGFLYIFPYLYDKAIPVTKRVLLPESSSTYDTFTDRIFLLSAEEVGLSGSSPYEYYSGNSAKDHRIKTLDSTMSTLAKQMSGTSARETGDPWPWSLRDPGDFGMSENGLVSADGSWNCNMVHSAYGIVPAFVLPSSTEIRQVNSNNIVDLAYYPVVSVSGISDKDTVNVMKGFTINYTFTAPGFDNANDARCHVYIRDTTPSPHVYFYNKAGISPGTYSFTIPDSVIETIPLNTSHDIRVGVANKYGMGDELTMYVYRHNDAVSITTAPITTTTFAKKIIVQVDSNKTTSEYLKIEATNNANASTPIWENITTEILANKSYSFVNVPSQSSDYGVAVRVTANKSTYDDTAYINSLSFRYY